MVGVQNVDPTDLQSILAKLTKVEAELAAVKAELARKNEIIAALQHRLFGSSSERLDPLQLQLEFDAIVLGKPAVPAESGDEASAHAQLTVPVPVPVPGMESVSSVRMLSTAPGVR